MEHLAKFGTLLGVTEAMRSGTLCEIQAPRFRYDVLCFDKDGNLKWEDFAENLVTNQGINDLMSKYFKGAAYTASHFVGIVLGPTPTFAGADTALSHAGWTEYTSYSEANRQTLVLPVFSGTTVDNSASRAVFTCTGANATVSGAFISTSNAKGGTAGVLYSEALFTQGDKLVSAGDILSVLATLTGATQ